MKHYTLNGAAYNLVEGKPVPEGAVVVDGPVPGPPPPTKQERSIARLAAEMPGLVFSVRDDSNGFDKLKARARAIEAEEAARSEK